MKHKKIIGIAFLLVLTVNSSYAQALVTLDEGQNFNDKFYGSGIGSDGLANVKINYMKSSYRFRAEHSGETESVGFHLIYANERSPNGYWNGNGGQVVIEIQTDDGTDDHFPSGVVLDSYHIETPMRYGSYPAYFANCASDTSCNGYQAGDYPADGSCSDVNCGGSFPAIPLNAQLEEGKFYHVVFSNPVANPVANLDNDWVCLNRLLADPMPNMQPRFNDADLTELLLSRDGEWQVKDERTPILSVKYKNGEEEGQGYTGALVNTYREIGGNKLVRERFSVSGQDRQVSKAYVRLNKSEIFNPGNLIFRLETEDSVLEEGTVPVDSITTERSWIEYDFREVQTLEQGEIYYLALESTVDNSYNIHVIQKGTTVGFNFGLFDDGYAQYSEDGSNWENFPQGRLVDLQFYFELCGDGSCNGYENCSNCEQDCGQCPIECGNGTCEAELGESTETCPSDCQQECIRKPEMFGYIEQWERGEIGMQTLMQKMKQWKAGTGC